MLDTMDSLTSPPGPSTSVWVDRLNDISEPLLTWYSEGRVDLSGPVLARWLAKVDNYLDAEFPFGGGTFHLALPDCWQRTIWEAGALLRGWEPAADPLAADLVISDDASVLEQAGAAGLVAVAQPTDPLGLQWVGALPPGVVDAPGELLSQSDDPLASLDTGPLWAIESTLLAGLEVPPGRVFVQAPNTRQLLQLWWNGGSALVIDNWEADQKRTRALMRQERAQQVIGRASPLLARGQAD